MPPKKKRKAAKPTPTATSTSTELATATTSSTTSSSSSTLFVTQALANTPLPAANSGKSAYPIDLTKVELVDQVANPLKQYQQLSRAVFQLIEGKFDSAVLDFQSLLPLYEAKTEEPKNNLQRAAINFGIALAYHSQGNSEQALIYFAAVRELTPDMPWTINSILPILLHDIIPAAIPVDPALDSDSVSSTPRV